MSKKKLILDKCEIEGCNERFALHKHHIIDRCLLNTTNHIDNLAILCATHHNYVHLGRLKIIGVYPSTKPPNGRTLIYELDGKKNVDIDVPIAEFKPKLYKLRKEND